MTVWVVETLTETTWANDHILGIFTKKEDAIERAKKEIKEYNYKTEPYTWFNGDIDYYLDTLNEAKISITQIALNSFD